MVVVITNITDIPGLRHTASQIDIYNHTINPGESVNIRADLITSKIKSLEQEGLIALGALPSWYVSAKNKNKQGKKLTDTEKNKLIISRKVHKKEVSLEAKSEESISLVEKPTNTRGKHV